jgi:vacuolar-type H+-ATPase subunit I/STV1
MSSVEPISESLLWGYSILIVSFVVVIAYSLRKGGIKDAIREMMENLFLWFLLSFGFLNLFIPPSDVDDEISAGILFVAFGICRIAKHIAMKNRTCKRSERLADGEGTS